jgi:serine/threonine protein kinase
VSFVVLVLIHIFSAIGKIHPNSNGFLLLERLDRTLETQNRIWNFKKKDLLENKLMRFRNRNAISSLWNERIEVAIDLADVMSYLHTLDIVFRDLKPANCGFDMGGVLKLFDFGLAIRIDENQDHLSGCAGSPRYMAPEVACWRSSYSYGKPCDVYSFAILLWETVSLKEAYLGESRESHASKLYGQSNYRPRIKSSWPFLLRTLLRDCWSVDVHTRPSFDYIKDVLRSIKKP